MVMGVGANHCTRVDAHPRPCPEVAHGGGGGRLPVFCDTSSLPSLEAFKFRKSCLAASHFTPVPLMCDLLCKLEREGYDRSQVLCAVLDQVLTSTHHD